MQSLGEIGETHRREISRRHIESLESWLRRVIDHQLRAAYKANYESAVMAGGNPIIPPKIKTQVDQRIATEPHRYPRWIDATQLNEVIRIIQHLYRLHFSPVFAPTLPEVVVDFALDRLNEHRNPLMHGGACSTRMLEQSICYTNDITDACKRFFTDMKKEKQFDAPTFTRFVDSAGNVFHITAPEGQSSIFDARKGNVGIFQVGNIVTFEVEVDETYSPDTYKIFWNTFWGVQGGNGSRFTVELTDKNVSVQEEVRATLVSNNAWHRNGVHDDFISVMYCVLPAPQ
jgi:hypothetical protein